jgi:8-oxo-dGTP pyrophosphatase MutT (NUDIX family)
LKKWKILRSRPAFVNPWWLIVEETVRLPDGSTTDFYVNHSLGGVLIFALTGQKELLLVRQYKHGARKILLELPIGRVEEGDRSRRVAALRELREETGYVPGRFRHLGDFLSFPTSSTAKISLYLAEGCRRVGPPEHSPKEITEVVRVPLERVESFLLRGRIPSIIHVGAAMVALSRLRAAARRR